MDNDFPTIISFYTMTWEYPEHATRLRRECKALGLKHCINECGATGTWLGNTRLKAAYIYNTLKELKRPVLWIDVDGSIYRKPEELKLPVDIDFMGRHQRIGPMRTWHVGTLFFNYNEKVLGFLKAWKDMTETNDGTDEASFEAIWLKYGEAMGLSSAELPPEYFGIHGLEYNKTESPIVVHRLSKCQNKMATKHKIK